jgi:hypothetical protein
MKRGKGMGVKKKKDCSVARRNAMEREKRGQADRQKEEGETMIDRVYKDGREREQEKTRKRKRMHNKANDK